LAQQKATRIKEEDEIKTIMSKFTQALEKAQRERENKQWMDTAYPGDGGSITDKVENACHSRDGDWEIRFAKIKYSLCIIRLRTGLLKMLAKHAGTDPHVIAAEKKISELESQRDACVNQAAPEDLWKGKVAYV